MSEADIFEYYMREYYQYYSGPGWGHGTTSAVHCRRGWLNVKNLLVLLVSGHPWTVRGYLSAVSLAKLNPPKNFRQ